MGIKVALAGNPNCGKTTLFNELTGSKQHVGNWPGVTVDKKEGNYRKDKEIVILDLPGTYSLSPYTQEEIIARDYIVKERPDVVINIVDGTSIERNLYLTMQIMETGIPMVIALNMMDEVERNGTKINVEGLASALGVRVVPIVARSNKGINELMNAVREVASSKQESSLKGHLPQAIEEAVVRVQANLQLEEKQASWVALKLIEGDEIITEEYASEATREITSSLEKELGDVEALIADARYKHIAKIVKTNVVKSTTEYKETTSDKLDKILTNRFFALPIFAVIMYLMFAATFSENFLFVEGLPSPGIWLAGLAEEAWGVVAGLVDSFLVSVGVSDWLYTIIMSGAMEGVGAVIGFLPLVLVLFLLLSFLEDSGYMARVAFVMDRIFRHFGLSGRSFIPMLMGFGCSVPALMASRTLESDKDRKITMMITPFMSCGAKLPIYAMFAATLFPESTTIVTYSIYMLGIVVAIISAMLLNKFVFKGETSNFVMELPQYRIPTLKSVLIHAWEKIKGFAIKAGTVIFVSQIVIAFLSSFNFGGLCEMDESFLAMIGSSISWIFTPLGFNDWRATVGIVTGWIAKENIVATFGQLFAGVADEAVVESLMAGEQALPQLSVAFTQVSAYAYMAFNLLCMPCFAAVGAIKREMGSWKWTLRTVGFQMAVAYVVALLINVIGNLVF